MKANSYLPLILILSSIVYIYEHPKYASAFFQLTVDEMLRIGEFKNNPEALAIYSKQIEMNPKDGIVYFSRGNKFFELNKYTETLADYSKAIELNPKDSDAYFNRGNTFVALQKYSEALKDFSKAIELDPKDKRAYVQRGYTFANIQEYPGLVPKSRTNEMRVLVGFGFNEKG